MPIHCCAMQGRMDAIQALLFFDTEESIKRNLEMESEVLKSDNYPAVFFCTLQCQPRQTHRVRIALPNLRDQQIV